MSRCRLSLALMLAALALVTAAWADDSDDDAPPSHIDLFVFYPRQLVVVRLFVQPGGQELPQAWQQATEKFFRGCDADHNGTLTGAERRRVPTPEQLNTFGMSGENAARRRASAQAAAGHQPPKPDAASSMSLEQFRAYLLSADVVPFRLEADADDSNSDEPYGSVRSPTALFAALDADGNGRISQGELSSAWQNLARFDLDEDGKFSGDELLASSSNSVRLGRQRRAEAKLAATLDSAGSAKTLARRLLEQYDGRPRGEGNKKSSDTSDDHARAGQKPDGQLSAAELGWKSETFALFDADGSGQLDFEELTRLAAMPVPNAKFTVRYGGKSSKPGLTGFFSRMYSGRNPYAAPAPASGEWDFAAARLELKVGSASATAGSAMQQMFATADKDKSRTLDKKEAQSIGSGEELFAYLDFDGDGKVPENDWKTDCARLIALAEAQLRLHITDLGQPLFTAIDANQDGRLDRHELEKIGKRVAAWDLDGDGAIASGEIPRLLRAVTDNQAGMFGRSYNGVAVLSAGVSSGKTGPAGPRWFQAMDRNGDRELSRQEFVAPLERFQQLDADHDGFISATEAEAATAAKGK